MELVHCAETRTYAAQYSIRAKTPSWVLFGFRFVIAESSRSLQWCRSWWNQQPPLYSSCQIQITKKWQKETKFNSFKESNWKIQPSRKV